MANLDMVRVMVTVEPGRLLLRSYYYYYCMANQRPTERT